MPGEPGKCIACDATEVPYDGIDNDCNSRTLDLDLDGDGDNSLTSAVRPGGDCDDNDPAVNSKLAERCDDGKDNNCNGVPDEPACGDLTAPLLSFVRPTPGAHLRGRVEVELDAADDVGIKQVELFAGDQLQGTTSSPPFLFQLDTTTLADGPLTLRATATDVADRVTEASIMVGLDNFSGPTINPLRPRPGRSYGGRMTVQVEASDAAGVASVSLSIDGAMLGTFTSTPYSAQLSTLGLADGTHAVQVSAVDATGVISNQDIEFLIDNSGPVVGLSVTPNTNGSIQGDVTVTVNATDPAGIERIISHASSVSGTDTLSYVLDTLALPNGTLVLTATAADTAEIDDGDVSGNMSVGSLTVNVTNPTSAPPRVVLTAPTPGEGVYRKTILTANANSPQGVQRVYFYIDADLAGFDETTPYSVTADFSRYAGLATASVRAVDGAGVEATDSATVTVVRPATLRAPSYLFPYAITDNSRHAVGDADGDGVLDLVMAGTGVSLLLGQGGGAFELARAVSINRPSVAVAIGDANGDGANDIFALRQASLEVYTNSSGIFTTMSSFPFGNVSAADLALGDVNGDGRLDVVVARGNPGGDIIVLLNRDNAGFGDIRAFGQAGSVYRVVLKDIDDDTDLDVVLGRRGGGSDYFTVYRNDGAGNFGAGLDTLLPGQAYSVAAGDINGDGTVDVAAAIPSPGTANYVAVAYGVPASPGQFNVGHLARFGTGPSGVALGDMDGDGDLEVVVTAERSAEVGVFTRVSDTNYAVAAYAVTRDARYPVLADIDGDGTLDLVANSQSNNAIAVAFNRSGLLLAPESLDLGGEPGGLALGDLTGDGRPDATVSVSKIPVSGFLTSYAFQQGSLALVRDTRLTNGFGAGVLAVGDLDGRGGLDFAFHTAFGRLVLDDGAGMTELEFVLPGSVRDVGIGDVDNDGEGEAVFVYNQSRVASGDGFAVYNAAGVLERDLVAGEGTTSILIGRLNDDSLIDVAAANLIGDNVAFFTISGGTVSRILYSGIPGPWGMAIGRVGPAPADAHNDLFVSGTNRMGLFLGDANLDFLPPTTWDTSGSGTRIASGDLNLDGLTDAVVIQPTRDRIILLIARAGGGFFGPEPIDIGDEPTGLQLGDIDGNGKPDIVVSCAKSNTLAVVYNDN